MEKQAHQLYSLYKRSGSPHYYAQIWDDEQQTYTTGRSTGSSNEQEAHRVCQKWLKQYGGLPPSREGKKKLQQKSVINYLKRFLVDAEVIEDGCPLSVDELISKTALVLTGTDLNRDNPVLVDYLLKFWDWDKSPYIKDKLESGQSIGKTYCDSNKRFITTWVAPFFGDMRIRSITTVRLEEFKNQLPRKTEHNASGLMPRSINAIMGCISTPLGEAKRLGIISENPSTNMRKLSTKGTSRGVLTPEEVQAVHSVTWADERSKVASQLAACHGLRAGEIGALRIQDIDTARNIIYVRGAWERKQRKIKETKNGHERILYSDEQLIKLLLNLYAQNPHGNDFIFWNLTKKDEPMNLDNFRDYLADALVLAGISLEEQERRKITFHSWRHFSNSTLRGNISDPVLRQAMGHLSEEMTDRYYHMTEEQGEQYRAGVRNKIIPLLFDKDQHRSA